MTTVTLVIIIAILLMLLIHYVIGTEFMSLESLKPTINGDSIHDDLLSYSQPPGITIINDKYISTDSFDYTYYYLDGEYFVCIDVECAAIGYGHFDSFPCRIGMVDFYGNILFDSGPIFVPNLIDPSTEFTGLTSYDITNNGKLLDNVLLELHNRLYY